MEIENNLPSWFPFANDANCGDFTLLFCRGRLRIVQSYKRHVLAFVLLIGSYFFPFLLRPRYRGLLKVATVEPPEL